jgi:hypothetical protein
MISAADISSVLTQAGSWHLMACALVVSGLVLVQWRKLRWQQQQKRAL